MSLYTKDQKFYELIWKEREHRSEVSGSPLGDVMQPYFMSHLVTKGTHTKHRHDPENLMLMTPEEHNFWEHNKNKIRNNPKLYPKWQKVIKKYDELWILYNHKVNLIRA